LGTNPFLVFLLSSIFEVFGTVICTINDRIGHKKILMIYLVLSAFGLFSFSIIPEKSNLFSEKFLLLLRLGLILLSRAVTQSSYITSFTLTAELFETKNRTTAMLFLNSAGSILSLIAPQMNLLGNLYWKPLPYLIYSLSSILACIAVGTLNYKNID
jgi:MFS family permease